MNNKFFIVFILFLISIGVLFFFQIGNQNSNLQLRDGSNTGTKVPSSSKEIQEPTESEKFQASYSGIYSQNLDYKVAYAKYLENREVITNTIHSGSGSIYFNYSGTDVFIPMIYVCETYSGLDSILDKESTLRERLKKSKSIFIMKDEKGSESGDFRRFNSLFDNFIEEKIGYDEYVNSSFDILSKIASVSEYYKFAVELTDMLKKNQKIDCENFLKNYY